MTCFKGEMLATGIVLDVASGIDAKVDVMEDMPKI